MRCPVCQIHQVSPQDNNNILFDGMCSECLSNCDYYYRDGGSKDITEQLAVDEGLTIINDLIEQDFIEPYVKKEIKNVRRRRQNKKSSTKELLG